jgi:hypothetical protein
MKTLQILLITLLLIPASYAQRIKRDNAKWETTIRPLLPVKDVKTVALKFYYPDNKVTQDSLWRYKTKVPTLNGLGFEYEDSDVFSYLPLEMVNDGADMLIEVAFQPQPITTKQVQTRAATISGIEGKETLYSYQVLQDVTTLVKVTNSQGEILDMWEEDATCSVQFGDEAKNVAVTRGDSTVYVISRLNYYTEAELEAGFQKEGLPTVNRKAVLKQMGRVFGSLHPRIFFTDMDLKLSIASATGRKHDYTDLDNAQKNAVTSIETNNPNLLNNHIEVWKQNLTQYDPDDSKARINSKVKGALHGNLAIAYLFQGDYNRAYQEATAYAELASLGSGSDAEEATLLTRLIPLLAEGEKVNGELTLPEKRKKPFDFEKLIERRGKINDFELVLINDRMDEFRKAYDEFMNVEKEVEETTEASAQEAVSPLRALVSEPNTANASLDFNFLEHADYMEKPIPDEVTQFSDLTQLSGLGMKFTALPENIGNLQNLWYLFLPGSNLSSLPSSIGNLSKLETLNVKGSQLTELPETIGQLTALKNLNLANNQLSSLPESIKNCVNLQKVTLKGNNFSDAEIAKIQGWLPAKCKIK